MVRLGRSDLEGVLGVVRVVAGARDPDEFSRAVITEIAALIPSDVVTINEVDPEAGRTVYLAEPASFVMAPDTDELLAALADQHPLIHNFTSTGDGSAYRISDFWTQDEFHASPIYELLYGPMGVEYQIAVALPAPRPVVVGIAASRRDTDFSERDRAVLNMLRPHLVQAWYNAKDQGHLRALLSAASDATADSGAGLIVLADPPHEVTPGALLSLYRFFGRPTSPSALPARVGRWMASQRSQLDGQGSLELLKPLQAEIDGRRVVLRYLPGQPGHPGALLLREERRRPQPRSLDALGLTAREAEIVGWVITGETNAMIGATLHVSPTTVKKHLDNIYVKLGVRGRGRLTAFVLDVLERQPVLDYTRRSDLDDKIG
jgi:DNA-binding CsgD family transcriptional regulator